MIDFISSQRQQNLDLGFTLEFRTHAVGLEKSAGLRVGTKFCQGTAIHAGFGFAGGQPREAPSGHLTNHLVLVVVS